MKLEKWTRSRYSPTLPLGDNRSQITGSQRHIDLSRKAATEGTVLLKNEENTLPLKKGTKLAIFGIAQFDYVCGGGGSGDVYCEYRRNIYEALRKKDDHVKLFHKLSFYYQDCVLSQYEDGKTFGCLSEVELPDNLLKEASEFTDTALITICRYSTEGEDHLSDGTDPYYELSDAEKAMIEKVCANFKKIIVTLNTGAMIDTSWFSDNEKIQSALMIWQGGMEGALSCADILVGDANPSGKLVDTCARNFSDYPSSYNFHESPDFVEYTEDIFVGYRYFETVPGKKDSVIYPFGYGLSYTTFDITDIHAAKMGEKIVVSAKVTNTGSVKGKEVVQVYYSAPTGKITKPALELCAFRKTKELNPGDCETLLLSFDISSMASYDDTGIIEKSAYVLEKGSYTVLVGNSVRNLKKADFTYELSEDTVTEKLTAYCTPTKLTKRLTADGTYDSVVSAPVERKTFPVSQECKKNIPDEESRKMLIDVVNGEITLDEFVTQLTEEEMIHLLRGHREGFMEMSVSDTGGFGDCEKYGIPFMISADGPAGLRSIPEKAVYATAFPVATMLACTWNTDIVEEVGRAEALELRENNLFVFLAPALNIHRSPLCGRNFEYFSEDPFIAGKMAAANVIGIQSEGVSATAKHFACNNKETNRYYSDSILSERALREIYIKAFEICVKEAHPRAIMSSYNLMNGSYTSENAELITGILRNEWGFDGIVMTDWCNKASQTKEVLAGNDVRMPNCAGTDLPESVAKGEITRNDLATSVKRVLEFIMWFDN